MLKARILTALVLGPLVLWAILALATPHFALLLGLVFLLGSWEWGRLVGLTATVARLGYSALIAATMGGSYLLLFPAESARLVLLAAALGWWLLTFYFVLRYPGGNGIWQRSAVARGVAGVLILIPSWFALLVLHQRLGPIYVVVLMLLIWGADTGAYFAGRTFGRRKLAPAVSPGKSWEGVIGGLLLALLVALAANLLLADGIGTVGFLLLTLLTVAISIEGDLLESLFKRMMSIKDSGGLLPGHGGIMDRIDSLTAAAPLFTLGMICLSR